MHKDRLLTVAYGGGRNSTAMLIGFASRGITPDLITFADTGGEKPATYSYVERFNEWCQKHLGVEIVTVQYTAPKSLYHDLESSCIENKQLPSIAYGFKSCSEKWKKRPQEAYIKQWGPAKEAWAAGETVWRAIGYDADETHRGQGIVDDKKYSYWYPLREWDWGLDECKQAILDAGLCPPPKSSCFFCPAMRKTEVIQLSISDPKLFDRAVVMERNAEVNNNVVKGLGRHWSWEQLVKAHREQTTLEGFLDPEEEPCGCWDGERE